jgi:hypothetical protein
MTTIAENTGLITLINVFTVEPSNQQKLLDILARATDTSVRDVPALRWAIQAYALMPQERHSCQANSR